MKTSSKGLKLIKEFEGCRLTAYKCPAGVWTIGYGHTGDVKQGQVITQAQAEAYLQSDLVRFEKHVEGYDDKYHWNQNQFDALVSFAFNVGNIWQLTANGTRTVNEISEKMLAYNKAAGKVLEGLTRRRKAEKELFDTPVAKQQNTEKKQTFNAYKGKVTAKSGLNIRKEASEKSDKLGAVAYGTTIQITNEKNNWGQVTITISGRSITGWVCLYYIRKI